MLFAADPVVSDVTAKQRYPWNGLVDVTCNVSGMDETTKVWVFDVASVIPDSGKVRIASHFWVVRDGAKLTGYEIKTNGNYRLLWDAKADLGEVFYSNMVVRVDVVLGHQKVQLWEGGPYWADTNIGAEKPEDYGYYFWWGDTIGYKRENSKWVATDGSSSNFSVSAGTTPTYNKSIATLKSEGWITADSVLVPEHDAAHVHWGGEWRMPTDAEFSALINNCTTTWITTNGVSGRLVTGKGAYANSSIFLPAAGYGYDTKLYGTGSGGNYWSSTPNSDDSDGAGRLYFNSSNFRRHYIGSRDYGRSVRPVRGFAQ